MANEQDRYIIRFPEGMREKIKEEAARHLRTMNAEIIFQLSQAYGSNETKKADAA